MFIKFSLAMTAAILLAGCNWVMLNEVNLQQMNVAQSSKPQINTKLSMFHRVDGKGGRLDVAHAVSFSPSGDLIVASESYRDEEGRKDFLTMALAPDSKRLWSA